MNKNLEHILKMRKICANTAPEILKANRDQFGKDFADRYRNSALLQGFFAIVSIIAGDEEYAGYFARCAFQDAANCVSVMENGFNHRADEYDAWLKEQHPITVAKVEALIETERGK